jgi:hypothetical protein
VEKQRGDKNGVDAGNKPDKKRTRRPNGSEEEEEDGESTDEKKKKRNKRDADKKQKRDAERAALIKVSAAKERTANGSLMVVHFGLTAIFVVVWLTASSRDVNIYDTRWDAFNPDITPTPVVASSVDLGIICWVLPLLSTIYRLICFKIIPKRLMVKLRKQGINSVRTPFEAAEFSLTAVSFVVLSSYGQMTIVLFAAFSMAFASIANTYANSFIFVKPPPKQRFFLHLSYWIALVAVLSHVGVFWGIVGFNYSRPGEHPVGLTFVAALAFVLNISLLLVGPLVGVCSRDPSMDVVEVLYFVWDLGNQLLLGLFVYVSKFQQP